MATHNHCTFLGNLTRDPELRFTQSGKAVAKFTLAVNNPFNKDETLFIDVVVWGKLAEACNKLLKKGSAALAAGRLVIRSYDDREGTKRKATELVASTVQALDRREDSESTGAAAAEGDDEGGSSEELESAFAGSPEEAQAH